MRAVFDLETLDAVEVCFSVVSKILYCEPSENDVGEQVGNRMFREAPFGMDDADVCLGLEKIDSWCREVSSGLEEMPERVASLKREWFRLFVGAGTPDAPCWESFYLEPNNQLLGRKTLEVRGWYKRYGLQIEHMYSEPDDHLGLMLGFVGCMVNREAEALGSGDLAASAKASRDQEAFLVEHVLPWLSAWRYQVERCASSQYFQGVANLVFGLCKRYVQRFGIAYDENLQVFQQTRR